MSNVYTFDDVGNYCGELQIKEEGGQGYWRVDSDIDEEPWLEIPSYLYQSLLLHFNE